MADGSFGGWNTNLVLRRWSVSLWSAEPELTGVSTSLCATHWYSTKSHLIIKAPQLSTSNLLAQILTSAGSASIFNQPNSSVSATATSGIKQEDKSGLMHFFPGLLQKQTAAQPETHSRTPGFTFTEQQHHSSETPQNPAQFTPEGKLQLSIPG